MKTCILSCVLLIGTALTAQTTWYQIAAGTHKKLNTVDFPSSKVGYIGGNDSLLLKTTNGGESWTPLAMSGVTFNLGGSHILNLDFVTETTGFMVVGPYNSAYKTTDGGSTWVQLVPAGNLCFVQGLYFFDAQNGFVGGSGCFQGELIEKMTAGTLSTTIINSSTWMASDRIVDIDFLNTSFGLAVSHGGNVLRTTNGGLNWDSIPSGQPENTPLTSVAVINNTLAYAGYNSPGNGAGLLYTTDGGLTWTEDGNSATFFYPAFLSLHEAGSGTIYSGAKPSTGNTGLIFENTGGVWTYSGVDQPINDLSSYSNSVVVGVGDSGYVVVNQLLSPVGLTEDTQDNYLAVYPNPVNDLLTISALDELKGGTATLFIYAVTGETSRVLTISAHDVVDISDLSGGLYLLELRDQGLRRYARMVKE